MKCPNCDGKGMVDYPMYADDEDIKEYPHRCPNCNGKGFYSVDWQKVRCDVCKGSGKKSMTEQEYLQACTTEQLAEEILGWWVDGADTYTQFGLFKHEIDEAKEKIVAWLKQPHEGD